MKRFFIILLAVFTCVSSCAFFASCEQEHTHSFASTWTSDATHHWHECSEENCLEVSDKAAHTWNNGSVTTDATSDKDGIMTYTCTVCNATKAESFEFAGADEETWKESIAEQKFDNVTINYTITTVEMTQEHTVKIVGDKVYRGMKYIMPGTDPMIINQVFDGDEGAIQKDMFLSIFLSLLAERDNFVWNPDDGVYTAPQAVTTTIDIPEENATATETMTNGKVKLDASGNLLYFSCTLQETITSDGAIVAEVIGDAVWTFSNYGTTVITESAD